MKPRLGYLGPAGTFSEEAARLYQRRTGLTDMELVAYRTIADVLAGVAAHAIDIGVVPVENSIEGSVVVTLDFLAHEADIPVTGEVVIPIRHFLLVLPGTELAGIKAVCSHPQALAQCRQRLGALLPGAAQQAATSTAEAARLVGAGGDKGLAAIGTALAGELYGLTIAASDLQDTEGNATRFMVIGGPPPPPTGADKTSLVFGVSDAPGALYRALAVFADRDINLSKLESRPARRNLGDYLFFVDLAGHVAEASIQEALVELGRKSTFVKVFGSYPRGF